jgi:cell division protein FtsQ
MTTLEKKSRSDSVRQRRSTQTRSKATGNTPKTVSRITTGTARQTYHPAKSIRLPVEPRSIAARAIRQSSGSKPTRGKVFNRMVRGGSRYGSEFAFSLGRTSVHAPAFSLPELGPRWISAGLTLLLGIMLYTMWTANTFQVETAEVSGNQRLATAEVSSMLGLVGHPIFEAIPAKIQEDLRTAFPDLEKVSVSVAFPNHIRVNVVERKPILIWSKDGAVTTWIDAKGVAFTPRGEVSGLIPIVANGNPPTPAEDPAKSKFDQAFIDPSKVQAILTLFPQVPAGSPMVYDPIYGMGWQDPGGWSVYFGLTPQDMETKKIVYQSILDTFKQKGIQPTLISMEYLDAPFYK